MALGIQHSEVMSSSIFPRASTPSDASFGGTTFSTGRRRLTPAQRAKQLFKSLIDLVQSEWKTIRALNLGEAVSIGVYRCLALCRGHILSCKPRGSATHPHIVLLRMHRRVP